MTKPKNPISQEGCKKIEISIIRGKVFCEHYDKQFKKNQGDIKNE